MTAMMNFTRRLCLQLAGVALAGTILPVANAQSWPTKPVRLIVPFAPGGTTDTFARLVGQMLSEHYGQQFYVENLAGASGNQGTDKRPGRTPTGIPSLLRSVPLS